MNWLEWLVLGLTVAFVAAVVLIEAMRKKKGKASLGSDCDCGGKGKALVGEFRAKKKKEDKKGSCLSCLHK